MFILPVRKTGFLPILSESGPNRTFPISTPAKKRDPAKLTLYACSSTRYHCKRQNNSKDKHMHEYVRRRLYDEHI